MKCHEEQKSEGREPAYECKASNGITNDKQQPLMRPVASQQRKHVCVGGERAWTPEVDLRKGKGKRGDQISIAGARVCTSAKH